jgi:glycerophosphoryl diester phosphodiesterase
VAQCGAPRELIWLASLDVVRHVGETAALIDLARRNGISSLSLPISELTESDVATARQTGFGIGAWRCHDPATIRRALALGVDVFTTDRPDLALDLRSNPS